MKTYQKTNIKITYKINNNLLNKINTTDKIFKMKYIKLNTVIIVTADQSDARIYETTQ